VRVRRLSRPRMTTWLLYAGGAVLAAYLLVVLALVVAGRRTDARALAGFVPDCVILFSRLLRDPRVPRRSKILVAALIPYLALPIDLIPDFIPVAGQADDAILVALVLRVLVKRTDAVVLRELWPGPDRSLLAVFRLAGVRVAAP
jgi:uncharacterized membrane protein YkvA (DUF1232 family)